MSVGPFILEIDDSADESVISVLTPYSVIVVTSVDDLERKLRDFADPIPGAVKNTRRGRRWYVEKILPALRYFCRKYQVDPPDWLADVGRWRDLSKGDSERLFGPGELRLREFQQPRCPDIAVVRPGDEEPAQ